MFGKLIIIKRKKGRPQRGQFSPQFSDLASNMNWIGQWPAGLIILFPVGNELSALCRCHFRRRFFPFSRQKWPRCSLRGGDVLHQSQVSWVSPSMGSGPSARHFEHTHFSGCVNLAEQTIQRRESFRPNSPPCFARLHTGVAPQRVASVKDTSGQLSCLQFAGRQGKSHLTSLALSLSVARMRGLVYINSIPFP